MGTAWHQIRDSKWELTRKVVLGWLLREPAHLWEAGTNSPPTTLLDQSQHKPGWSLRRLQKKPVGEGSQG